MRSLKKLYTILYNRIKDNHYISGLCGEITGLHRYEIITYDEYEMLHSHFRSQKYRHDEFMTPERNWSGNQFWWNCNEDYNPVNRIAFIKKLMENN